MAGESVLHFTDDNFETDVLGSETPVLVDFWAEWCMPCKMLAPTVDELAREYDGKVKFGKVDIDADRKIASQYGIQNIPTVLIFSGGQLVKTFVGLTSKKDLKAALDAL
jgi:thioredoxin 1